MGLPVFWLVCWFWLFVGAVLLVVLFCLVTGIPLFAFRMHKVVIHSKTVTIVIAQEQKKNLDLMLHRSLFGGKAATARLQQLTFQNQCLSG